MLLKLGALLFLAFVAYGKDPSDSNSYDPAITEFPYDTTQEKPQEFENQPGCFIPELNRVIPFDQNIYLNEGVCTYYLCEEETLNAYKFSCRDVDRDKKGCKITEGDKSAKFPACCDLQDCD